MEKKKKKKGFSLIEMMIVIAIIAILVSVVMPAAQISLTKANAATNAANLRAVKAQVSKMLLEGQIKYDNSSLSAAEVIVDAEALVADALMSGDYILAALLQTGILRLEESMSTDFGEAAIQLVNTYYGSNGEANIDGTVITAPQAKPIKISGINLRKGTEMTITVGATDVIVTYGGINIDTFAYIAQYGDESDPTQIQHDHIDSNGDGMCDICSKELSWNEQGDSALGGALSGSHVCNDTDGDCICDDPNCGLKFCANFTQLDASNHQCTICGTKYPHYFVSGDYSYIQVCVSCNYMYSNQKCTECGNPVYTELTDGKCAECTIKDVTSCVTPDTLITLADGSKKRVDQLTGDEELLIWNLETGALDSAPIMFVDSEPEAEVEVIYLHFSDDTVVKVITEHGFWDYDLNKYIYLNRDAAMYIGHSFFKQSGNGGEKVQLVDVELKMETSTAWSPVTENHLCYFVNDMLSMPGGVGGLFNIFEVDPETMTYDYEAMAADIENIGLLSYEELASIMPVTEEMFNAAGGAYLKISMAKGNLTEEELVAMVTRYSGYFG